MTTPEEELRTKLFKILDKYYTLKNKDELGVEPENALMDLFHQALAAREIMARLDEAKKALDWFTNESGYLFYLDDRLTALQQSSKEGNK